METEAVLEEAFEKLFNHIWAFPDNVIVALTKVWANAREVGISLRRLF